tara:strand:+ start:1366 stop:1770 length:405 start_codon:yes stop_codon:yes gene_type:complete
MRKIDEVIIHCSATTEDDDGSIKTNGYHYVVRRDGQVDTGRPIDKMGAHISTKNNSTIHICYIGGVEQDGKTPKDTLNDLQESAIKRLYISLCSVLNKHLNLSGHNEGSESEYCPSFNVQEKFSSIHTEVIGYS